MSRALAAQSSTILTDIAVSIEKLNTPATFTVVMRDFYQRFGDFWNSMPQSSLIDYAVIKCFEKKKINAFYLRDQYINGDREINIAIGGKHDR